MSILESGVIPKLPTGYNIEQSLRVDSASSAYLSKTFNSAGNRKTWTLNFMLKRCNLSNGTAQKIISTNVSTNDSTFMQLGFDTTDKLELGIATVSLRSTTQVFRDTASFYNIHIKFDTTQATSSDRVKIAINGSYITSFSISNDPALNGDYGFGNASVHEIARNILASNHYGDFYLSELRYVNGQALDPNNFGEFDETYGHWKPKKYTGTYGTNGFYQKYANGANIGEDSSGNGNDFTATNLSATDIVLDSPTNNFAMLNVLQKVNAPTTISEGSLKSISPSNTWRAVFGNFNMSSGKWYWEVVKGGTLDVLIGIQLGSADWDNSNTRDLAGSILYNIFNGNKRVDGAETSYGATCTNGDIIGIALDMDSGTIEFYKNNASQGSIALSSSSGSGEATISGHLYYANEFIFFNFGQDSSFAGNKTAQGNTDSNGIGDFYYEPPSGYLALCTANLPEPTVVPSEHFDIVLSVGNGSTQSIVSDTITQDVGFAWTKGRSFAYGHNLRNIVSGGIYRLDSSVTNAETSAEGQISFTPNGFDITTTHPALNNLNTTFVNWLWKAGGTPVTNNDGTITSQVSANVDAGFSIVNFSNATNAQETVGTGLSREAELAIYKQVNGVGDWFVLKDGGTKYLRLNTTGAEASTSYLFGSNTIRAFWTTSEVIAYCFHSVDGYSKVFNYKGNGNADGTFIPLDFTARWIMLKVTSLAGYNWVIFDTVRSTYNIIGDYLSANTSDIEGILASIDIVSNGIKIRTNQPFCNSNGATYIGVAFAEHPFKYSNAK